MTMKSVSEKDVPGDDNGNAVELVLRRRALEVISQLFPSTLPNRFEIERVAQEIIHTDKNGAPIEKKIAEEMEQLKTAHEWAKKAWPHDGASLSAALDAYDELYGESDEE
jgi:hypothetical protein